MSTPLQKALDSMTRYSALKQPPLSTAQGGSTSPFSIFRPSQNSPAPLKKRPSPKENARHPIGGKSGQQGFNKRESLGRGKGGVWGGEGEPYSRKVPLPLPNAHYFTGLNNSQSPAISKGTHKSCPIVSQPKAR